MDELRVIIAIFVAVNPAAAAGAVSGHPLPVRVLAVAAVVAAVVYTGLAVGADAVLDGLDVEPETFRVSAGLVMAAGGVLAVVVGSAAHRGPREDTRTGLFPFLIPALVAPAGIAAVVSYGADEGAAVASAGGVLAVAVAAAATWIAGGRYAPAADALTRVMGAVLVAFAGGLVVDGVRAI